MINPDILAKELYSKFKEGSVLFTYEDKIESLLTLIDYLEVAKMKYEEQISIANDRLAYGLDYQGDIAFRNYYHLALVNRKRVIIDFFQPISQIEREFLEEINRKAQKAYHSNKIALQSRLMFVPRRKTEIIKTYKNGRIEVVEDTSLPKRGKRRKRIYIRTAPTPFELKPTCPNCQDEKKDSFYFDLINKQVCRKCGNEWSPNKEINN